MFGPDTYTRPGIKVNVSDYLPEVIRVREGDWIGEKELLAVMMGDNALTWSENGLLSNRKKIQFLTGDYIRDYQI